MIIAAIVFVFFYLLPTFVSPRRGRASVFVINLFLGWTFIGWVVALAMAVRPTSKGS